MGILSRGIRPQNFSSEELRNILDIYGGGSSSSGIAVNTESAMRLITVMNCVVMRSFTLSRLPCHIMETDGVNRNKASDFYLYEKLLHQPNSWMTAKEFWRMAETYVALTGNFVAYKSQLPGRPIRELIPITQGMLQEIKQNEDFTIEYKIKFKNGETKSLNNFQVLHLKGLTLNGYSGLNPIEYARETIGKGLASEHHLS